jgi:autotransporter-associated beta strand protein
MRRSLICSAAGMAAIALAASKASATLAYSFETLYDSTDTINPAGTRPDDFHPNGGGATVTQSTIGVTNGAFSMEFTQVAGATFTGAQTEVIPAIINDPNTVALSFDITIPATGNFAGTFARIGISEFGNNDSDPNNPIDGAQVQTVASSECNIDLAPGTYQLTIPLIAIDNPVTGDLSVPFSSCFGTDTSSQLTPASFEFYFNKSNNSALNVYIDNVQTIGPTTVGTWNNAGGGSWSTLGDWSPGIPQFALDTANLTSAITGNSIITLDGNRSLATLNFDNAHQYTIAQGSGGGTLTLDAGGSNISTINDSGGTHTISAPVNFNTSTTITVNNAGDAVNISGGISGIGGLTVQGSGTVDISGSNTYIGGTTVSSGVLVLGSAQALPASNSVITIAAGAKVQLANSIGGVSSELPTIAAGGSLDLTNNHLFVSYTTATQAAVNASVRGYLINGYNDGTWTGTSGAGTGGGINSSTAALPANSRFGLGYADGADGVVAGLSSGQIEIKYTLYGDANLDGIVSGDDFTILVGNLGKSEAAWDKGDFNYDGVVSGDDFTLLVGNLGKAANGADVVLPASDLAAIDAFAAANGLMADVPEPTSAGLLLAAGVGMLARRGRRNGVRA